MDVNRWYLETFSEVSEERAGCLSIFFSVPGVRSYIIVLLMVNSHYTNKPFNS
jgi:hypothetical protein